MPQLIIAISDYAGWLVVGLALLGLREVIVLARSGREHDAALFGLEREAATGRALRSLITLFLLSTIGLGVYLVAEVLAPALPEQAARLAREDTPLIETPPTVMLPTDTPTAPPATSTRAVPRIVTAAPETAEPTAVAAGAAPCRNRDMQIVSPVEGATVEAGAEIVVTVRFAAGSGRRFWLELGAASDGAFRALGPAHAEPVERAALERVPEGLEPGRHVLRLVMAESSGGIEPDNVCDVQVLVR